LAATFAFFLVLDLTSDVRKASFSAARSLRAGSVADPVTLLDRAALLFVFFDDQVDAMVMRPLDAGIFRRASQRNH
jgi:hypothetical protein